MSRKKLVELPSLVCETPKGVCLRDGRGLDCFEVITVLRFLSDKRPATLVLPAAPRRPTRGGHQAGWVNMPSGSRGARRQQQSRQVRYDLHLPSMPALTCKTSSQALLLRVLKVILQLREAARRSSSGATTLRTRALQRRGATGFVFNLY